MKDNLNEIESAIYYYRKNVNYFTFFGSCFLLAAKIHLILYILRNRSCAGISGKTQILYTLVFLSRCLDLLSIGSDIPILVSISKSLWVPILYVILLLIYSIHKDSYDKECDNFKIYLLIIPCIILALRDNYSKAKNRSFWSFSVYLESIASFPQFHYAYTDGGVKKSVHLYLSALGIGKLFDLAAEAYNCYFVPRIFDDLTFACGCVQLFFYCVFLRRNGRREKKKKKEMGNAIEERRSLSQLVAAPINTAAASASVQINGPSGLNGLTTPSARPNDYV